MPDAPGISPPSEPGERAGLKPGRKARPKIEVFEVINVDPHRTFTDTNGERIVQGMKATINKKQAYLLLKSGMIEILDEFIY